MAIEEKIESMLEMCEKASKILAELPDIKKEELSQQQLNKIINILRDLKLIREMARDLPHFLGALVISQCDIIESDLAFKETSIN